MKYLLDVNALVALGFLQHEFHERIARWVRTLTSKGAPELITCSITELGFVRVLAQAPQYGFSVAQARTLLLRLKAADVLRFTFIPMTMTSPTFPPGPKPRNRLPMATSRNSPERRAQFLRHWMEEFLAHS